jgi:adenine phosphoribosyltransferase
LRKLARSNLSATEPTSHDLQTPQELILAVVHTRILALLNPPKMATLEYLKRALVQKAKETSSSTQLLSDSQYSAGFDVLLRGPGQTTYRDFIMPELSYLLAPLQNSSALISVLEIGPGPRSVFVDLSLSLREKIGRYTAFEPNTVFATKLGEWFDSVDEKDSKAPFPGLQGPPEIHDDVFDIHGDMEGADAKKYDIVLFCHSMYGMKSKHKYIERALKMVEDGGIVAVFHRDGALHIDGLVCHHTASFPTGVVRVEDEDEALDCFATFVAGFTIVDEEEDTVVRTAWREVCRSLGRSEEGEFNHLSFSAPEVMVVFNHHATALPDLTTLVPLVEGGKTVKSREARVHRSAPVVRPKDIQQIQHCVQWALKHELGLTVVGGGHSGHCLRPNVVAVDMDAFDGMRIHQADPTRKEGNSDISSFVVFGSGCKTEDIIKKTMAAGLTVPLGSRPSVGVGLCLQGGIGHLTRLHGLTSDNIIGAVMVGVTSGEVLLVGSVPKQDRPTRALRPENEAELLWALKGAGTNFGIVTKVVIKAYPAPTYLTRNWVTPLTNNPYARYRLAVFNGTITTGLESSSSADAYLYSEAGQLHLGVTTFDTHTTSPASTIPKPKPVGDIWGPDSDYQVVDGVGLFETEMYISGMHGGHGGGKTSSFKRCLFLKNIGDPILTDRLIAAVNTRPSPLCYLHLLHGGGAARAVPDNATAFGCRDWDFACVITGVWPRDQDGTNVAQSAVRWVYGVVGDLLPMSRGVYGADLGPDPRDTALVAKAFGANGGRLARLKRRMDPHNVLAYACPILKASTRSPKLIVLVTGESCAGKDHCARVWASAISVSKSASSSTRNIQQNLDARVMSISEATKREYATATGADLSRLLCDRTYKEQNRPRLTEFFDEQVRKQPKLLEEHFLTVVRNAIDVDVLFVTGMRDEAPVASFAHLVPDCRLIEVHVEAREDTRQLRGGTGGVSGMAMLDHRPCLFFNNDKSGDEKAVAFAEQYFFPFLHEDLKRLGDMVHSIPDFPIPGTEFRHVLNIAQQPGGLALCTSLLRTHFTGDWAQIDVIVSCEVSGLVFASALASRVDVPLVPIREAGRLPPPTITVGKSSSHISSLGPSSSKKRTVIEMEQNAIAKGAKVVVIDDVLSTGETLCAVLQLLGEADITADFISVMLVAEFPVHGGRDMLRKRGFGKVQVQSLLVFGGR